MIKVAPYFKYPPSSLWEEASKKRSKSKHNKLGLSRIEQSLVQKEKHDFDNQVYGASTIKNRLKVIFKCKCAFCETNTHAGAHKDVEHFRFKNHYYWLGYEWSNLLLSCQICNRDFKNTNFPLEDESKKVTSHPVNKFCELDREACYILSESLKEEKPLLLHPAIDNPKEHIQFLPNGSVKGISPKGIKSVEIYGLERDQLNHKRKAIILKIQKDLFAEYNENPLPSEERISKEVRKVITKLITDIQNEFTEYRGFHLAIMDNFADFVINNTTNGIDLPDKDIMLKAAKEVLD